MPILKFFPYESFCIVSQLEPDVLQVRLQNEITFYDKGFSRNADRFFEPDTHFLGFAGKYKFNIKPYLNYNNWLLPKITGTIDDDGKSGSIVSVKMNLSASATTVISVCMVVVILACASVITLATRIITYKGIHHFISTFNYLMLIPFIVLVLGHILIAGAFKQESRKARTILLEMFEGQLQFD